MKASRSPVLATWMLERLVLGGDNDALAGDLLEEFREGRSVGWYWRQVLVAIFVGFSKELGRQWRAAVFAFAWTIASIIALHSGPLYHATQMGHMLGWAIGHDWPESMILFVSLETFPLFLMWWFGLGLYLLMMRRFTVSRLTRGVVISLFFGLLACAFDLWAVGTQILMQELPREARPIVYWMPWFLALLLSLCATLPSTAIKRTARIRVSE